MSFIDTEDITNRLLYILNKKKKKSVNTKAIKENEKLVSLLNKKIFRGFIKTRQLCKISKLKEMPIRNKETLQDIENYKPYPFEDFYNVSYKEKYLKTLNGPDMSTMFDVTNESKIEKIRQEIQSISREKKSPFITTTDIGQYKQYKQGINNNLSNTVQNFNYTDNCTPENSNTKIRRKINNNQIMLKKIFQSPSELNKYSEFNFIAIGQGKNTENSSDKKEISRQKHENSQIQYRNKNNNINKYNCTNSYAETEFLYKISHKPEHNNFMQNLNLHNLKNAALNNNRNLKMMSNGLNNNSKIICSHELKYDMFNTHTKSNTISISIRDNSENKNDKVFYNKYQNIKFSNEKIGSVQNKNGSLSIHKNKRNNCSHYKLFKQDGFKKLNLINEIYFEDKARNRIVSLKNSVNINRFIKNDLHLLNNIQKS